MEVSGGLHASAALPPGIDLRYPLNNDGILLNNYNIEEM
jgi:hypothetical protein